MDIPGGAGKRINPLSRRPKQQRLVVAVRGAAGTGKSYFAASLAQAGLGRLCYFDTERKARLLPGSDGSVYDALEVQHPDELPEFIDWALESPEGRAQGYGCYALDSWAMYFGRKHRETVMAVRARTGDPTAQPGADELASDQIVYQEVLRRLCVDSGACVVIVDQIGAKGREDREENEMGRVLPMTVSGLEYFVDVLLEVELRLEGLDMQRVFRVVKSNSPAFPIGLQLVNPVFADLLARLHADGPAPRPVAEDLAMPEFLDTPPLTVVRPNGPTLESLILKAEQHGFSRANLITAAMHYCNGKTDLERLNAEEIEELDRRMTSRIEAATRPTPTPLSAEASESSHEAAAPAPRSRRAQ